MASSLEYKISGNKNCGPTFTTDRSEEEAVSMLKEYIKKAMTKDIISKEEFSSLIFMCRNRSPPDKCNPWLKVNSFDRVRMWPTKVKSKQKRKKTDGFEVEFPLWLYTNSVEHDFVLRDSGATFVMNERYLSDVVVQAMKDKNDNSTKEMCYATMLRKPLDRAVSHWKHERKSNVDLPLSVGFEEYLDTYLRDNLMTRTLCGTPCVSAEKITHKEYSIALKNLKNMDAVLIMEHYAESLSLLEKKCGKPWTRFEMDVSEHSSYTNALAEMKGKPRSWLTKLRSTHRWDILLYAEGQRIFYEKLSSHYKSYVPYEYDMEEEDENEEEYIEDEYMIEHTEKETKNIQTRYISEYGNLANIFKPAVGAGQGSGVSLRIKFPSLFTTSHGGYRILFNLRNDKICEGYLVAARVDVDPTEHLEDIPVAPFDEVANDAFIRASSERNELFNAKQGVTLLPVPFPRKGQNQKRGRMFTFTGPEDARVVNSPDGKQAYIVFNCKTKTGKRQMAVIDYNKDPSTAVFLEIRNHQMQGTEKNWMPFFVSHEHYSSSINRPEGEESIVYDGERLTDYVLHFVYMIGPTIVLACPDVPTALREGYETVECDVVETDTNDVNKNELLFKVKKFGKDILVRGSSGLVEYRWPYYIGLVHSRVHALKGRMHGNFWKPCYRSQLIVLDAEQMLPVHLSETIHFSSDFVKGLQRMHAHDTYNHYATGLYNAGSRWYIGIDFDDQHPVIGELTNLEQYMHHAINEEDNSLTYYGNGDGVLRLNKEHVRLEKNPRALHNLVDNMESTRSCTQKRMKTSPMWRRVQDKCARYSKTNLTW
jgi:hypothetical protein